LITAWRLVKKKYSDVVLSGEGASQNPGRWNLYGVPVVYACSTPSLAVLEVRVHAAPEAAKIQWALCKIEFPKSFVTQLGPHQLPADWNAHPHTVATQEIGSDWARKISSLVLMVPSVFVPEEFNVLINPLHPEFSKIQVIDNHDYFLDARLFTLKKP